jgi:hypothetical protein
MFTLALINIDLNILGELSIIDRQFERYAAIVDVTSEKSGGVQRSKTVSRISVIQIPDRYFRTQKWMEHYNSKELKRTTQYEWHRDNVSIRVISEPGEKDRATVWPGDEKYRDMTLRSMYSFWFGMGKDWHFVEPGLVAHFQKHRVDPQSILECNAVSLDGPFHGFVNQTRAC